MSLPDFKATMTATFEALGLPAPPFQEDAVLFLTIDTFELRFEETRDGEALKISCPLTPLSQEAYARSQQIHLVLKNTLAYLPLHRACVTLTEQGDGETPFITGQAVFPYASPHIEPLLNLIEDIIEVAEDLSKELHIRDSSLPQGAIGSDSYEMEGMYLTP